MPVRRTIRRWNVTQRCRIIAIAAIAAVTLVLPAHPAASASNNTTETAIIVDTDMGLDDVRALFAMLAADIDIHAIVTVEGSAAVGKGTNNVIGLLESIPRNDILVCRGAISPLREPPSWRHTANTLGGSAFPPPRRLESRAVMPGGLALSFGKGNERFRYLALGPLCNVASLIREYPESFSVIEAVWIPAKVDPEGAVTGWNLRWDPKATASVLREAPAIVIIDMSDADTIDAYEILTGAAGLAADTDAGTAVTTAGTSVAAAGTSGHASQATDHPGKATGHAPAARWIARTLSGEGMARTHLFLHDELAAVALIAPELISISNESYRASFAANGDITLDTLIEGNIRIARIRDIARTTDTLRSLWQSPIAARYTHAREDHLHGTEHANENHIHQSEPGGEHNNNVRGRGADDRDIPIELLLRTFHGHLGPYVVLGYRMGTLALERTGSKGHFGISAEVHSILKPPPSCLIDGVQLGSGCTLGKRNITIQEDDGPAYVLFTTGGRTKIRIALRSGVPDLVTSLVDERGVEAAGREMLGMKTEELFEIEMTKPSGKN